jgi:hypothetical protein
MSNKNDFSHVRKNIFTCKIESGLIWSEMLFLELEFRFLLKCLFFQKSDVFIVQTEIDYKENFCINFHVFLFFLFLDTFLVDLDRAGQLLEELGV